MDDKSLVVFQDTKIRRTWFNEEWWFVATDIIAALTDSKDPTGYLKDMRRRDEGFAQGWGQIAILLSIQTQGGIQNLNCVSTKGALRLIQSVPSKKAEPFKQWLAKTGYERIQEIENPELAQKRMRDLYKAKGYSDEWIEKRVRGIVIRDELTNEWEKRGVKTNKEYSILTAEIAKATFGMTPSEYSKFKGLNNENLRDHMNDLELIFTMLGERVTTEITKTKDARGFDENKNAAKEGGEVAGSARRDAEKRIGKSIISSENYVSESQKEKRGLLR